MPGRDRTGPMGYGQGSGRGMGPCGRGLKRGFGRSFWYTKPPIISEKDEKEMLKASLEEIETEKQAITKRLKELK